MIETMKIRFERYKHRPNTYKKKSACIRALSHFTAISVEACSQKSDLMRESNDKPGVRSLFTLNFQLTAVLLHDYRKNC